MFERKKNSEVILIEPVRLLDAGRGECSREGKDKSDEHDGNFRHFIESGCYLTDVSRVFVGQRIPVFVVLIPLALEVQLVSSS